VLLCKYSMLNGRDRSTTTQVNSVALVRCSVVAQIVTVNSRDEVYMVQAKASRFVVLLEC
jgi:hypothetical protein